MILIGFMGAGKTSIGRALSERLKLPFYDLDQEIVKKINMPIAEYFQTFGESKFRQLEAQYLSDFHKAEGVISTGGGCIETEVNRILLEKQSNVIYLKADFSVLYNRIKRDPVNLRPTAQNKTYSELEEVYEKRLQHYESSATYTIETDELSTHLVTEEIIKLLEPSDPDII